MDNGNNLVGNGEGMEAAGVPVVQPQSAVQSVPSMQQAQPMQSVQQITQPVQSVQQAIQPGPSAQFAQPVVQSTQVTQAVQQGQQQVMATPAQPAQMTPAQSAQMTPAQVVQPAAQSAQNGAGIKPKKNKKFLVIGLIALVVLAGVGVGLMLWKPWNNGGGGTENPDDSGDNSQSSGSQEKVVPLGLDNSTVKRLYNYIVNDYASWIYLLAFEDANVARNEDGTVSREMIINFAMSNMRYSDAYFQNGVSTRQCKMPKTDSNIAKRYAHVMTTDANGNEIPLADALGMNALNELYDWGCYDAEEIRRIAIDFFGQQIEFTDNERLRFWSYSKEYDEVYEAVYGRERDDGVFMRHFNGAERVGDDKINIYETVGMSDVNGIGNLGTDELLIDRNTLAALGYEDDEAYFESHLDDFVHFKWMFQKNSRGVYVFSGIETYTTDDMLRKDDMALVASKLKEYLANNGRLPLPGVCDEANFSIGADSCSFVKMYLNDLNNNAENHFADPDGTVYNIEIIKDADTNKQYLATREEHLMRIFTGAKCGANDGEIVAATARDFAIIYTMDDEIMYCLDS